MTSVRPLRRHRLTLAVAGLLPFAALAQQATETTDRTSTLDTVQVTAQRKVENVQDVPESISTFNPEILDVLGSGGQDVRYLSARVPSLNIESSFGRAFPRFYIRGYGNTDFRLNTSQPVSLVYDDVVQENPILKGFPIFDLERVEVLRGPQGTLFGRNSPAGVVKFDSAAPSQDFNGYAKLGYGSDNMLNFEGAVGGALSEHWSGRVSGIVQHRDDWVDNTVAGPDKGFESYDESAGRAQLLYSDDGFEALFNAHARHLNGTARLFRANIIKPGTNDLVDGFDPDKAAIDGHNHSELDSSGASARLKWDLGDYKLYSITGFEHVKTYSRGDVDGGYGAVYAPPSGPGTIPFADETADGIPKHRQITQEVRIESDTGTPFDWQAGLYYFDEDYRVESFTYDTLGGGAQSGYERIRQKSKSSAAFVAGTWQASDALQLRAGLRYTHDEKKLSYEDYDGSNGGLAGLAANEPDGTLGASPQDNKLSWDASATYKLADDVNLYARVATGYRGSSIQPAGDFNTQSVAGPETSTSYEAGIKSDFWDKRARLNFDVFHYEVKDQQLTAVGGSGNANILLNAKKSVGQGFELDFQAYLLEDLLFTLGSAYNHTEIKDPGLAVSTCGTGMCTVTDPLDANGKALIDGNPLPQAPKWTHSLTLRYGVAYNAGEFYALTDWTYRSEVNFFLYEAEEFTGKSLLEGGLRLGYTWSNGDYDLALYSRNITNRIRVVGAIDFDNLTGFINEPRVIGAEFQWKF